MSWIAQPGLISLGVRDHPSCFPLSFTLPALLGMGGIQYYLLISRIKWSKAGGGGKKHGSRGRHIEYAFNSSASGNLEAGSKLIV